MLGEAAYVVLAPDLFAVDVHVEDAAAALDEGAVNAVLFLDRIRQTGGCGAVISLHTKLDRDFHGLLLNPGSSAAGSNSEKHLEPGMYEMEIVCERLGDSKPPHDQERYVVDNARSARFCTGIGLPCTQPLVARGKGEESSALHFVTEPVNLSPIGASCGGIRAFQKDVRGRNERRTISDQLPERTLGRFVPLITAIPQCE